MQLAKLSMLTLILVSSLLTGSCSKNATVPVNRDGASTSGNEPQNPDNGPNNDRRNSGPTACRVENIEKGAAIICPDGSREIVHDGEAGKDGRDGRDGDPGRDGSSCSAIQKEDGVEIKCTNNTGGFVSNGKDGSSCGVSQTDENITIECDNGSVVSFPKPKDGGSCSAEQQDNGVKIICDNGTNGFIPNPEDGKGCEVSETQDEVSINCANGSSVTFAKPKAAQNCKVSQSADEVTITCPDSVVTFPKPKDGNSCEVSQSEEDVTIKCGADTVTFPKPEDGDSCSVSQTETEVILTCEDGTSARIPKPNNNDSGSSCNPNQKMEVISTLGSVSLKELNSLKLPYDALSEKITTTSYNDPGSTFGEKKLVDSQIVFALELTLPNRNHITHLLGAKYEMSAQKLTAEADRYKRSELLCLLGADVCSGEFITAQPYISSITPGFDVRSSLYADSLVGATPQRQNGRTLYVKDNLSYDLQELFRASRTEVLDMLYNNVSEEQANSPVVKTKIYFVVADDTYVIRPQLHLDLMVNTCGMDQGSQDGGTTGGSTYQGTQSDDQGNDQSDDSAGDYDIK